MRERLVRAEISLSSYRHNLHILSEKVGPSVKLMAVVKANAYGHGIIPMAQAAAEYGIHYFGVICLKEARMLRDSGINTPILILNYIDPEGACIAIDLGVSITVMDEEVIKEIGEYCTRKKTKGKLHLKVDTGMHRAGVLPNEVLSLVRKTQKYPQLELEGIFTHFASADDPDLSFAKEQLEVFHRVLDRLKSEGVCPPLVHAANSAATLMLPESHFSMVRPGIVSYGLSPFDSSHSEYSNTQQQFKPILSLKTEVVQLRTIKAGESVGYGRAFIASQDTKVGLLPVGYGDGFRRGPTNWGEVLIKGKRAPILGRVSMDQTSIDITAIEDVNIHDEVILLGKQGNEELLVDAVAKRLGTINYEAVTMLTERIERIYL